MYKCKYCNKEFDDYHKLGPHAQKEHGKPKFNPNTIKIKKEKEYYENPQYCKYCGALLSYDDKKRKKVFCSNACSASFNNKERTKKETKKCLFCHNDFDSKNKNQAYCSFECSVKYKNEQYIAKWLEDGKLPIINGGRPSKIVRDFLLNRQNNRCAICDMEQVWNGKQLVFILDHIDGNSSDSSEKNLRMICPNCDSQTDTYKAKNKGNGRFYRRERMKEGKSY